MPKESLAVLMEKDYTTHNKIFNSAKLLFVCEVKKNMEKLQKDDWQFNMNIGKKKFCLFP